MPERTITKIEALPKLGAFSAEPARRKKVAAYARVSTDHEEQETSFEAQKDYYEKLILGRPDWELVKIYADQGISAAGINRRKEFSQMIEDCEAGLIDIVLVKSLSRFARNTVDSLVTIRRLKELGIGIWFEKESIWTLDARGELLITIMSSISQEESRSISENVKWGRRKMFQDGKGSLAYSRFLGYDKGRNKFEMVVNEEEAAVVRRIYRMFLQGFTCQTIAKSLTQDGIPTPSGGKKWSQSTVRSICENEKYKGDFCMQKYYYEDFPSKKCHRNDGQLPMYYVEEDHEAIIEPAIFDYVQDVRKSMTEKEKINRSGVDYLSGKVFCGKCGLPCGPRPWHSTTYNNVVWQCRSAGGNAHNGKNCKNHHVYDEMLKFLIHKMVKEMMVKRGILDTVMELARATMSEDRAAGIQEYLGLFVSGDPWLMYEDLDDLAFIIKRVTVTEDGRLEMEFVDGDAASCGIPEYSPIIRKAVGRCKDGETAAEPQECDTETQEGGNLVKCKQCGAVFIQSPRRKEKKFCCDECRKHWWNSHKDEVNRQAYYEIVCDNCGKMFIAYGAAGRKFCCQECYRESRFGRRRGKGD